jgi:hypothetical protein
VLRCSWNRIINRWLRKVWRKSFKTLDLCIKYPLFADTRINCNTSNNSKTKKRPLRKWSCNWS